MNHLLRPLAPISDEAWEQIDNEAQRALRAFLAARRLVDFSGPHGWEHSALGLGRLAKYPDGYGGLGLVRLRREVQEWLERVRRRGGWTCAHMDITFNSPSFWASIVVMSTCGVGPGSMVSGGSSVGLSSGSFGST